VLKEKQFCMKNVRGGQTDKRRAINFRGQTSKRLIETKLGKR